MAATSKMPPCCEEVKKWSFNHKKSGCGPHQQFDGPGARCGRDSNAETSALQLLKQA
jgi:hypothetical protein